MAVAVAADRQRVGAEGLQGIGVEQGVAELVDLARSWRPPLDMEGAEVDACAYSRRLEARATAAARPPSPGGG